MQNQKMLFEYVESYIVDTLYKLDRERAEIGMVCHYETIYQQNHLSTAKFYESRIEMLEKDTFRVQRFAQYSDDFLDVGRPRIASLSLGVPSGEYVLDMDIYLLGEDIYFEFSNEVDFPARESWPRSLFLKNWQYLFKMINDCVEYCKQLKKDESR